MVFSSSVFLMAFLPATLLIYFIVPGRFVTAKNLVLLIASLLFYGWGEPKYIAVMLLSIIFNYILAILTGNETEKGRKTAARIWLIFCIAGNLGLLGFFKYTDFLLETVNSIADGGISLLNIALPIGISFYTFQTMSYVVDVYWGNVKAQKNFIALASYITLFPQLIAGPIVRYKDVAVQLVNRRTTSEQAAEGIRRFVIGFGKKVLLANQIFIIWKEISSMDDLSMATAWLGALAFTFQIYFDFSGYSDMAIGLGKILGFDYLENFNYPYISRSITEFWRRWHMSLSSWFREYVYIPLGGNRRGAVRQLINIGVVWLLTGLWHGSSWNFVVWGAYFGIILIVEKLVILKILRKCPAAAGHIYSLFLIVIGWVIFAVDDLGGVADYLSVMFGGNGITAGDGFWYFAKTRIWLFIACIIGSTPVPAWVCRRVAKRLEDKEVLLGTLESLMFAGIFGLSVAFLVSGSYNPFLYFRF